MTDEQKNLSDVPGPDETTQVLPAPAPATPPAPAQRGRTGLIVLGVAAAMVLAGGIGAAVALAVSGDDDENIIDVAPASSPDTSSLPMSPSQSDPTVATETTDVDGMLQAYDIAVGAAPGEVHAVEEVSPGIWEFDIVDGSSESVVRVDATGAGSVTGRDDDDDDDDDIALTPDAIERLIAVATQNTPGRVVQIESDDDDFTVDVRTASGSVAEIDVNANFEVTEVDNDDD